ncbi:hypothetical protein F5Y19DRAFT_490662 [Xylariaceae sp. FL1651]|nr:hypothetical protein F5Y19DRAFT_490662 [Xylariaceae sp. FL1651]
MLADTWVVKRCAGSSAHPGLPVVKPFGIVAGAIGIASAFDACLEVFSKIQIARRSDSDFQTCRLRLDWLRLRLLRWGEAVRVHEDPRFGNPTSTAEEVRTAKQTIFRILALFEDSSRLSKSFRYGTGQADGVSEIDNTALPRNLLTLHDNIQKLVTQRQRTAANPLKIAHWVIHRRDHLLQLIQDIASLTNSLEQAFPAPREQEALMRRELQQISSTFADQQSTVRYLQMTVQDIDHTFQKVAGSERMSGHRFGDQFAFDNARVQNGHTFHRSWTAVPGILPVGPIMTFGTQRAGGSSRIRNGDVYVEKDDFWT